MITGSVDNWLPAHFYNKEQCGGGAMIDLAAHPLYIILWFLGKPKSVQSLFTNVTDRGVEDNAVSIVEFSKGAVGVAETSFVSKHCPITVEISGTDGSLYIRDGILTYANNKTEGKWVEFSEYPESLIPPVKQWATDILNGKSGLYGISEAVELTKLAEAAYISAAENKKVEIV